MANTQQAETPASFESAVSELEALVAAMERDDLPLEQALDHYQRGLALLRHCQTTLTAAEQRIRILENGSLADFNIADGTTIQK
jgi:exodeoxyribonuclease VII small subunit